MTPWKIKGTYICGHKGVYRSYQKEETKRDRDATEEFAGVCWACAKEEQRRQEAKEAITRAQELELPDLEGTEKQVSWANQIRLKFWDSAERFLSDKEEKLMEHPEKFKDPEKAAKELKEMQEEFHYCFRTRTSSDFWIERRNTWFPDFCNELKGLIDRDIEKKESDELVQKEYVVAPDCDMIYPGYVKILKQDKEEGCYLKAYYEKNEEFKKIVKSLGYSWDGAWQRKLTECTGSYEERAAELGNKLLLAGFRICICNQDILQKAIQGTFLAESHRWIRCLKEGSTQYLQLVWERNDELYRKFKKLPGAVYRDGRKLVPLSAYEELIDFAELESFQFTKEAKKVIEQYKQEIESIPLIEISEAKKLAGEETEEDKLKRCLEAGGVILADLREE